MKHKVAELEGALLDAAAADAEPEQIWIWEDGSLHREWYEDNGRCSELYSPSTNWAQGGPIIERGLISVRQIGGLWIGEAVTPTAAVAFRGGTPLIAAMRAYVASKFGEDVELP